MDVKEQLVIMDAVMLYLLHTPPEDVVTRLIPQAVGYYLDDKAEQVRKTPVSFWFSIDQPCQIRLIEAAMEEYGESSKGRIAMNSEEAW